MVNASREAAAGGFLLLAGALVLALTWRYPSGRPADLGPGLVLQVCGGLIALFGAIMLLRAWRGSTASDDPPAAPLSGRPFIVLGAMALFALLLPLLGLAFTAALCVLAASFASPALSWRERLGTAVTLSLFVTLLFGYGLRLSVKLWPL